MLRKAAKADHEEHRRALIEALQAVADEAGPDVSVTKFCRESGYSNTHIYRYFENWGEMRVAAGLPERVDRSRIHARHTRESLIAAVTELAAEVGDDVSMKEFHHRTGISWSPIYRLFGTWRNFKKVAGLTRQRKPGLPAEHDQESVLALMKEAFTEHGTNLTQHDFCLLTDLSPNTIHRCGGWSRLRRELGLSARGRRCELAPSDPLNALLPDLTQLIWDPEHPTW